MWAEMENFATAQRRYVGDFHYRWDVCGSRRAFHEVVQMILCAWEALLAHWCCIFSQFPFRLSQSFTADVQAYLQGTKKNIVSDNPMNANQGFPMT